MEDTSLPVCGRGFKRLYGRRGSTTAAPRLGAWI